MTKTRFIVIGVISYLLFTLFLTPVSWWLKLLPLPAQLQLGAANGTLWQGEVSAAQYQQLQFDRIRWQLQGWQLLRGKLAFNLQSGSLQQSSVPYLSGVASYGLGGAALDNSLISLPVSSLVPLLPLPLPVDASGELVLDITQYRQGQPWCDSLTGSASWQNARLQTPTGTWLDLQQLFGTLSCDSGTVALTTDGANVLGLDIKAVVNAEQLMVDGMLKPEPSLPEEVHQAMQFLGKPDTEGRYRLRF
jgi:general secretion pathway protein N